MHNIDEIMDMLDWNNSMEVQARGIELAKHTTCINVFLRPSDCVHNKNVWENCAKILSDRSDQELTPYFTALLEWLKDLSWPGALCILDRVNRYMEDKWVEYEIKECRREAKAIGDEKWLNNLYKIHRPKLQDSYKKEKETPDDKDIVKGHTCNLDEIMGMLDWNKSVEEQAKGIELAKMLKSINAFIQPRHSRSSKGVWDNCAQILSERSDKELQPYLISLLEWLQDANWPGYFIMKQRLKRMPAEMLISPYLECVKRAVATIDRQWIVYLSDFIDLEELRQLLPVRIQRFMKRHYGQWTYLSD